MDWHLSSSGGVLRAGFGSRSHAPQCVALHLRSGYLRLCPSEDAGWGTSVVLAPSYWSGGRYRQGGAVRVRARRRGGLLRLLLDHAPARGSHVLAEVAIPPPEDGRMAVRVTARLDGRLRVDERRGEAFKPVVLASMSVDDAAWDAREALLGPNGVRLPAKAGWLAPPDAVPADRLAFLGGSSAWKTRAPTVSVTLAEPMSLAGWADETGDPNDDNVTIWAAADEPPREWSYGIAAALP